MSYILDALRKAAEQRGSTTSVLFRPAPTQVRASRPWRVPWIVLGGLLVVNVAVLVWVFRPVSGPDLPPPTASESSAAPAVALAPPPAIHPSESPGALAPPAAVPTPGLADGVSAARGPAERRQTPPPPPTVRPTPPRSVPAEPTVRRVAPVPTERSAHRRIARRPPTQPAPGRRGGRGIQAPPRGRPRRPRHRPRRRVIAARSSSRSSPSPTRRRSGWSSSAAQVRRGRYHRGRLPGRADQGRQRGAERPGSAFHPALARIISEHFTVRAAGR